MKYALLIYSKPGSHEALADGEREAALGGYAALSEDSRCVGGGWLARRTAPARQSALG
jgi:hypothetical protein